MTETAVLAVVTLVACSAPRTLGARGDDLGAEDLGGRREIVATSGGDHARPSNAIILAAGGSRPPPVPPRPPARTGRPTEPGGEPTRSGRVPGRRLNGPPDAPYWEPVFEIPWRGPGLQGPKPTPPQRAPSGAVEPTPPGPRPPARGSERSATGVEAGPKTGSSGGPGAGRRFSEATKDAAEMQAEGRCVFCGKETTRSPGPNQRNTDHAQPKSRGGNNSIDNAQNTCRACNLNKGARTTGEHLGGGG